MTDIQHVDFKKSMKGKRENQPTSRLRHSREEILVDKLKIVENGAERN